MLVSDQVVVAMAEQVRRLLEVGIPHRPSAGATRGIDHYSATDFFFALRIGAQQYLDAHGYIPDLVAPKTFNELLFKDKYFGEFGRPNLADKLLSRTHVRQAVGEHVLPAVAWTGSDLDELDPSVIPPGRYLLKASHGSGYNKAVTLPMSSQDRRTLTNLGREWLKQRFGYLQGEWFYSLAKPQLYLERFIDFDGDTLPTDYKMWVFHGKVRLIQVHFGRYVNHRMGHYDRDWNEYPFSIMRPREEATRPDNLEQMIDIAERLSPDRPWMRVDLYSDGRSKILFGEFCYIPGNALLPFSDPTWDAAFGACWLQPDRIIDSKIRQRRRNVQTWVAKGPSLEQVRGGSERLSTATVPDRV